MQDHHENESVRADIAIIGAGLTGLTLAYLLKDLGLKVVLLEARDRIGGRIITLRPEGQASLEMGATWFGKKHTRLTDLLQDLKLETFPQELGETAIYEYMSTSPPQLVSLPENEEPSYRIKGGTSSLIHALADHLEEDQFYLGRKVEQVFATETGLKICTGQENFLVNRAVSTIPPNLFATSVKTTPELPGKLISLMQQTHTWMGESIKFALTCEVPFWRNKGVSGTVFSNTGPVTEMYDHSDFKNKCFALKGFLNGTYYSLSVEERKQMILEQLGRYYGENAHTFSGYYEKVWIQDQCTYAPYRDHILPHQNNGSNLYRQSFLNGRLLISGSETAGEFPGYMDGAVGSAREIAEILKEYKP